MNMYEKKYRLAENSDENINKTFERLADLLQYSGKNAIVRCTIFETDNPRHWNFELLENKCLLHDNLEKAPDLEVITGEATWWEIAYGKLSPFDAFKRGRLRVLGDFKLGLNLFGKWPSETEMPESAKL